MLLLAPYDVFQKGKTIKHTKAPMIVTEIHIVTFHTVLIDTIEPLPRTENGNEYGVTIICDLKKYPVTITVSDKSTKTVAKAIFKSFVLKYGPMTTVVTDRE